MCVCVCVCKGQEANGWLKMVDLDHMASAKESKAKIVEEMTGGKGRGFFI